MLTPGMLVTFVTSEEVNETRLRVALEGGKTTVMLPLLERLENFGLCFAGGPAWRAWPLVLLALSGVGWSLLAMARQRKIAAIELSVAVLSLAMAALALALPFHGEAWQFFSPRFIPIALLTGLVLVPVERLGPRAYAVFAGCALVYNVASNAWMVGQLRDRRARTAEALAGLGRPVTPGRTMLPIIFNANATDDVLADPRTLQPPYVQPLHNLGDIYAIDRNAVVAYAFASMRTAAPVISRDDAFPPVPARDYRAAFARHPSGPIRQYELARLGLYGARFDDIVFYGTEADAAWLIDAGYEAEFWRGALLIAHFKGCDGTLRISGAPEGVRLSVGTGWGPFDRPGWFDNLPGHPEMEAIRLQRLPCGSAWVRVVPSDGALRCEHADETGTLVVRLPRSEPIECRLVRR
jgi:hypothetical protein